MPSQWKLRIPDDVDEGVTQILYALYVLAWILLSSIPLTPHIKSFGPLVHLLTTYGIRRKISNVKNIFH